MTDEPKIPTPQMGDLLVMPTDPQTLPPPDNGFYYVATKTGFMVLKNTFFGRALVPVKNCDSAAESNAHLWYEIPPLPPEILGQAWSFFAAVYDQLKTEAMVFITWHPTHGYRLFVPPQTCNGSAVHMTAATAANPHGFNPEHISDGWRNVGTIHSHCDFGAFHSGTDTSDADKQDGLHITIGHVNTIPDWAVMVAINGIYWNFKLEDITPTTPTKVDHPKWWHRYVVKTTYTSTIITTPYGTLGGAPVGHYSMWGDEYEWENGIAKPKLVRNVNDRPETLILPGATAKSKLSNPLMGGNDEWSSPRDLMLAATKKWPAAFKGWNETHINAIVDTYYQDILREVINLEKDLGLIVDMTFSTDTKTPWEETIFAWSPEELQGFATTVKDITNDPHV